MTINDELLNKLEKLSAIKISPDKREDTKRQLSEIVGFVEVLDELDLTNIDYAKHGQTPFRSDVVNLGNLGGNSVNLGENSNGGVEANFVNLSENSANSGLNSNNKVVDCFEQSSRNDGGTTNSTNLRQNNGVVANSANLRQNNSVAANSTNLRQNDSENSVNFSKNSMNFSGNSSNLTHNSTKNSLIDDVLAHAPKTDGQFFLVPKIIE